MVSLASGLFSWGGTRQLVRNDIKTSGTGVKVKAEMVEPTPTGL